MASERRVDMGTATDRAERGGGSHHAGCCCDVDIHIDSRGDVNIYNCAAPSTGGPCDCPTCPPSRGTCIPVAAGAKHKLSAEQKLQTLADGQPVPSSIAGGVMHMMRRFLLDKSPANPLEISAFATFSKLSRDLLTCTLAAFDATPPSVRNKLVVSSLFGDPGQPLDEAALTTALGDEVVTRIGVEVFGDPNGLDQERPAASASTSRRARTSSPRCASAGSTICAQGASSRRPATTSPRRSSTTAPSRSSMDSRRWSARCAARTARATRCPPRCRSAVGSWMSPSATESSWKASTTSASTRRCASTTTRPAPPCATSTHTCGATSTRR